MAEPDKPLSTLHHGDSLARWCERQATELDPLIKASAAGRPLSPYETHKMLVGVQELYRKVGKSYDFLIYFVPMWAWLLARLTWWRRGKGKK